MTTTKKGGLVPKPPQRFPVGEDGLTHRERLFVAEIQVDWNMTQAAVRAGYSAHSAKDIGKELMRKPKIVDALSIDTAHRVKKAGVNQHWVLKKLVDVHTKAEAIEGLGALDRRLKALELIGRHVEVDAFRGRPGFGPLGDGPSKEWDLSRLNDEELAEFERLLAKVDTSNDQPDGGPGGSARPNDAGRSGADDEGRGSDPAAL